MKASQNGRLLKMMICFVHIVSGSGNIAVRCVECTAKVYNFCILYYINRQSVMVLIMLMMMMMMMMMIDIFTCAFVFPVSFLGAA